MRQWSAVRILSIMVLVAGAMTFVNFTNPPIALADTCTQEDALFIQQDKTVDAYGSEGNIYIRDRDLDSNCAENPGAWSMVNVFSKDYNNQAEVGYRELAGHVFWHVACWEMGGTETCQQGASVNAGTWVAFKVANFPINSNNFDAWMDVGNGWVQIGGNGPHLPFSAGVAAAETGRYGSTTGALDHHKGLTYKNALSDFPDWAQQFKSTGIFPPDGTNGIPGYTYHKMTNTEYEVCQNGGSCPWQ
jgi:hypothetical protein